MQIYIFTSNSSSPKVLKLSFTNGIRYWRFKIFLFPFQMKMVFKLFFFQLKRLGDPDARAKGTWKGRHVEMDIENGYFAL